MPARAIDGGLVLVEHVGVVVLAVVAQDVADVLPQCLIDDWPGSSVGRAED